METDKKKAVKESSEDGTLTPHLSTTQAGHHSGQKPEWANGLRQLYDSVVEEPLPDSFKDLLSKLDDKS